MVNLSSMIRTILLSLPLILMACGLGFAETQVIALKDGSQIKGELVGVANGVYTISTETLGNLQIKSDQIASITAPSSSATLVSANNMLTTTPPALGNAEFGQKTAEVQN